MSNWLARINIINALLGFVWQVKQWMPLVIGAAAAGGIGYYLASVADWLNGYSAIAWYICGLTTALIFVGIWLGILKILISIFQWRIYRHREGKDDTVNPLDASFTRKRISICALADPVTKRIVGKTFVECELVGAAVVCISGSAFDGDTNNLACDFIVLRDDTNGHFKIQNVIVLEKCIFRECKFYQLVMLFNKSDAAELDRKSVVPISWLTKN